MLERNALRRARERLDEKRRIREAELSFREQDIKARSDKAKAYLKQIGSFVPLVIEAMLAGDTKRAENLKEQSLETQKKLEDTIVSLGYGPGALDSEPECSDCRDTGFIGGHICDCLKRLYDEEVRRDLSGLFILGNADFHDFSLKWYSGNESKRHMKIIRDSIILYAKNFGKERSANLLFTGPPGVGKTLLAGCIANVVADNGYSVVYDTFPSIFRTLEDEKFGKGDEDELLAARRRYRECDLLIADDLGTEMITTFTVSALYDLINYRLISRKPTIITTNLTADRIGELYDPAIASRFIGEYQLMEFLGSDIRQLKKRSRFASEMNHAND